MATTQPAVSPGGQGDFKELHFSERVQRHLDTGRNGYAVTCMQHVIAKHSTAQLQCTAEDKQEQEFTNM